MARAGQVPRIRKGQTHWPVPQEEFFRRFRTQFVDPRFAGEGNELEKLAAIAWRNYKETRKAPRTRKAGPSFDDPEYQLSVEWLEARKAIHAAHKQQRSARARSRIL